MSTPSVLTTSRFLLSLTQLGNKKQFEMGQFCIPMALKQAFYISPVAIFLFLLIQYCIDEHFQLDMIASAISLIFGSIQSICIYLCLTINNGLIINTFDKLQRIVNERSYNLSIECNNNLFWKILFLLLLLFICRL